MCEQTNVEGETNDSVDAMNCEVVAASKNENKVVCTFWGGVANLCSATLGCGVLGLPAAITESGVLCGFGLLIASAWATGASMRFIIKATDFYGERTYEGLTEKVLGKRARAVVEAAITIFCLGACVAYMVAVGDILVQSGLTIGGSRSLTIVAAWGTSMMPLSMLRTMNALESVSTVGLISLAILIASAAWHLAADYDIFSAADTSTLEALSKESFGAEEEPNVWYPKNGFTSILQSCPIMLFAFSCQINANLIFDELPNYDKSESDTQTMEAIGADGEGALTEPFLDDSTNVNSEIKEPKKVLAMERIIWIAIWTCTALYVCISIITIIDFGNDTDPNILNNYNPNSMMVAAFICMCGTVIMAYPTCVFPVRVTLHGVIDQYFRVPDENEVSIVDVETTAASGELAVVSQEIQSGAHTRASFLEHFLITITVNVICLFMALITPNISIVFGLVGGSTSSLLGFIIPGLMAVKVVKEERARGCGHVWDVFLAHAMVIVGSIICVVTTIITAKSTLD